jgi:hypothetical protein
MGLDMYLNATRYLWSFPEDGPDAEIRKAVQKMLPELGELPKGYGHTGMEVRTIGAEIGYWRKANQIHRWFVDNVQDGKDDCGKYRVEWEDLVQLRAVCQGLLEDKDPKKAAEILPVQAGFFFGGTDYDEYYWSDLERTVEIINRIDEQLVTETTDDGTRYSQWDFKYHSSW